LVVRGDVVVRGDGASRWCGNDLDDDAGVRRRAYDRDDVVVGSGDAASNVPRCVGLTFNGVVGSSDVVDVALVDELGAVDGEFASVSMGGEADALCPSAKKAPPTMRSAPPTTRLPSRTPPQSLDVARALSVSQVDELSAFLPWMRRSASAKAAERSRRSTSASVFALSTLAAATYRAPASSHMPAATGTARPGAPV
jgi:hypothetical protein